MQLNMSEQEVINLQIQNIIRTNFLSMRNLQIYL